MKPQCALLPLLPIVVILFGACSFNGGEIRNDANVPTSNESSLVATTPAISTDVARNRFIGAFPLEIVSIDPHKSIDDSGNRIGPLIYEGLVAMGMDGTWKGLLAESWDVSDDGLTWTFNLRQGVRFHNGAEVTSKDVVYSINRILDPSSGAIMHSILVDKVSSVEAIDEYTVRFVLTGGSGTFLSELGLGVRVAIIPAEGANQDTTIVEPIGTGPFKFVSWEPGGVWKGESFTDYWGQVPSIDEVSFITLKDDSVRIIALINGEVDWILSVPFDRIAELKTNDNLVTDLIYQNNTVRLNFNSTRFPFSDRRIRQAAAYAIDKSEINEALYFGMGTLHNQPFAENSFLHLDVEDAYAEPNIEKAKALLAEAGYPDGVDVTVIHPAGFSPGFWDIIAWQLDQAGIRLNVDLMDIPQLIERAQSLDYDMMGDQQSQIFHWDRTFSYFQNTSSSNFWVGGYHNDELVPMLEAGRNESNLENAKRIYSEVLAILQEDAATLFVLALPEVQAWNISLQGFSPNPVNGNLVWPGGGLNYANIADE